MSRLSLTLLKRDLSSVFRIESSVNPEPRAEKMAVVRKIKLQKKIPSPEASPESHFIAKMISLLSL